MGHDSSAVSNRVAALHLVLYKTCQETLQITFPSERNLNVLEDTEVGVVVRVKELRVQRDCRLA